jgi:hypothetical protein
VADDSYITIPQHDLSALIERISATLREPGSTIFAQLRAVAGGYCGYANPTLEYDGFIPFFFDGENQIVEFGSKVRLLDTPATTIPKPCR